MTAVNAMLVIIVLSLLAYALLAGADFGGGAWDLLAGVGRDRKSGEDQRTLISSSLGPVWEANHVWLIFVIVCVFSGFPSAFGDIAVSLELPLAFALVGIVLRGAAYVYRAYGQGAALPDQWWSRIFACASVLTPFMLGVSGAALATGRLGPHDGRASAPLAPFQTPFALLAGLLAVVVTAFLAAVYLCFDASQSPTRAHLVPVFRRKALGAAVASGAVALAMLPFFYRDAPVVAARFTDRSIPFAALSALCGFGSLYVIWAKKYVLARATAAVAVAGVLVGWAVAQYPDLMTGVHTAQQAAAAPSSLDTMLVAMCCGMAVILPSFALLLKIFASPLQEEH
ncbi:MAG TPA: cytochrome d ubiquinol oxidase subunit II [Actinocrinis sp.]|nr:cytochrome d ubiquinol oxidase subunit II [Actinocrinis sp.]